MITISHTHADGTLLEGSAKGDGVYDILKGLRDNWRYFPSIRRIGIGQSRDKNAQAHRISRAAEALRAAGHDVTIEISEDERRSFAEAEAERYERAEDRAGRMAQHAASATARSDAAYGRARRIGEMIPFGQPILVGHHSEGRHRRDIARIDQGMRTSIAEADKAEHFADRAQAAENYRASRENVPTTLRRIAKLEADLRRVQRGIAGRTDYVSDDQGGYKLTLIKPSGNYLARLESRAADLAEQIAYWREHVKAAESEGVKVWGPADFTKGDFVRTRWEWAEVTRVNPKSVTIPWDLNLRAEVIRGSDTEGRRPWSYDEVRGRKSAEEMAVMLAESAAS
jgi:Domain of unknown function (DUF3560)